MDGGVDLRMLTDDNIIFRFYGLKGFSTINLTPKVLKATWRLLEWISGNTQHWLPSLIRLSSSARAVPEPMRRLDSDRVVIPTHSSAEILYAFCEGSSGSVRRTLVTRDMGGQERKFEIIITTEAGIESCKPLEEGP